MCHALAFLAAPAETGTMKKYQPQPFEIYPRRGIYLMPLPDDPKPRVHSFHFGSLKLDYTILPTKFDRFGRITHESRLLEFSTKHSTLMFSFWE